MKRMVRGGAPKARHAGGRRRGHYVATRRRVRAGQGGAARASGARDHQRWRETSVVWGVRPGAVRWALVWELLPRRGRMVCDAAAVTATPPPHRRLLRPRRCRCLRQWPPRQCRRRPCPRWRRGRGHHPPHPHPPRPSAGRPPRRRVGGRAPLAALARTTRTTRGARRRCGAALAPPRTRRRPSARGGGPGRRPRGGAAARLGWPLRGGRRRRPRRGAARRRPHGPLARFPRPRCHGQTVSSVERWARWSSL